MSDTGVEECLRQVSEEWTINFQEKHTLTRAEAASVLLERVQNGQDTYRSKRFLKKMAGDPQSRNFLAVK
jgi:hypothetical protein